MQAHKMIKAEFTYEDVIVAGVVIKRPSSISPKQWVDYWERVGVLMEREEDGKHPFTPSNIELNEPEE